MDAKTKRGLMVSSKWGQAIAIVFLFGFFVLGLLAYRTYTSEPPIPAKVVDPSDAAPPYSSRTMSAAR